ncbi:Ig-like domain-containing protein [Candidatus Palauibacter sp.]|uniref:Ig-like domain-containing protein n=1 Tax=Candidatus Palauibacter sp. TaxID=3101350 RepID=UPI003B015FBD
MTRRARLLRCAVLLALTGSWGAACGDDGGEVTGPRETPNQGPVAVGEIAAQTAFLGDTVAVDVSSAFRDPDGDLLTFMAASSDTSVVGASVSGSRVSVVGVSRGSATMTVTARDPDGAEARQSFSVEVPNRGPMAVGRIEAQTLFVGETATVDASPAFSDPDGDELTFAAASSDTASVLASISGSEVTLEALKRGTATVTVTARDADSLEATVSFEVTVPNRPPAIVGEIEAQTLFVGETATVDASPAFSDPDGDELTFAAASSDTASVLASISGSEVRLEALKRGTATVTVTARDADSL